LPATMQLVSGDQQLAERGGPLPDPIVVIVADRYGNPTPEIEVAFAPQNGGKASPASVPTDAAGQAVTTWTLGGPVGDQFLRVDLLPLPSIEVRGRATPSSPYAIAIASGNLQTIIQHTLPGEALAAKVTDLLGDPLPGLQVEFLSSPGSGYIDNSAPFSTTDAAGLAVWQRGAIHSAGQQRISAKVSANASLLAEFILNVIPAGSPFEGGFAIGLESPIVDDGRLQTAFTFRNGVFAARQPTISARLYLWLHRHHHWGREHERVAAGLQESILFRHVRDSARWRSHRNRHLVGR